MKEEMTAELLDSWEGPTTEKESAAPPWVGVKGLMLAMLEDAINCLRSSQSLARTQAEQWITSRERRYVFSFAVICETLELEPSAVRRSVMDLVVNNQALGRTYKRSRPNVRHTGPMELVKARRSSRSPAS